MANPAAGLQVQFTDGDRLHVHIVTHLLQWATAIGHLDTTERHVQRVWQLLQDLAGV